MYRKICIRNSMRSYRRDRLRLSGVSYTFVRCSPNHPEAEMPLAMFSAAVIRGFRSKYRRHVGKKQLAKLS
jgi:hypothetical protein